MTKRRLVVAVLGTSAAVALGSILLGAATAASTARTAAGGPIVFLTPANDTPYGTIVVTGAIGDYGKTLSKDKNGKPDSNGNFVKVTLQKGTFEVDATALNTKTAKEPATVSNAATCSFAFIGSGPVTVSKGTGLYQGISGTLNVTVNFAGVGSRYASGPKKGQCNMSNNAKTLAQEGMIIGRGTVKFG